LTSRHGFLCRDCSYRSCR